jgi:hypothetical protein
MSCVTDYSTRLIFTLVRPFFLAPRFDVMTLNEWIASGKDGSDKVQNLCDSLASFHVCEPYDWIE